MHWVAAGPTWSTVNTVQRLVTIIAMEMNSFFPRINLKKTVSMPHMLPRHSLALEGSDFYSAFRE